MRWWSYGATNCGRDKKANLNDFCFSAGATEKWSLLSFLSYPDFINPTKAKISGEVWVCLELKNNTLLVSRMQTEVDGK